MYLHVICCVAHCVIRQEKREPVNETNEGSSNDYSGCVIDPLQKAWSTYKISTYYRSVQQYGGQFYIEFLQQLLAGTCTGIRS